MAEKKFIPALTGIRAIVVYCLFFYHLNPFSIETHPDLYLFINQFYVFVTFFFVLSGFLIYYKYHEICGLNKKKLYNYFVNRIARILPILIILTSTTFFLGYYHGYYSGQETLKLYLLNISLVKGFSSTYYLTGIGPGWSLSVEELFYLLSPLIFFYATGFYRLLKVLLLFFGIGFIITIIFRSYSNDGFFESYIFTASYTFFGRFFEFACGIFLGFLVRGKYPDFILRKLGKRTLYLALFWIILSITLLFLIAKYYSLPHGMDTWQGVLVNNILIPGGIAILFYNLIYCESFLQKFLSGKIMVELGRSTYSFYLLHTTFVLSYIFKFIGKDVFIAFFSMILISYIFFRLVEQPCAKLVRRVLHKN